MHTLKRQECQLWDKDSPYGWADCPGVTFDARALQVKAEVEKGADAYQYGLL